jgi:hypothetical protein
MNNKLRARVIELFGSQADFSAAIRIANENLYGGAAGPGKSHALRWEVFLWAQRIPGLQVYLLRRIFPELEKNHIMPSLTEFPREAGEYRDQKRRWEFKNGSMLHLRY